MAYVDFKNSPSEETPLTGGATGNLNVMQENGTSHGTDTKLGYTQSFLNEHIVNVSNEVDDDYRVNLLKSKNLFGTVWENGDLGSNGVPSASSQYMRTADYIVVKPSTQYTLKISASNTQIVVYYYSNGTFLNREYVQNSDTYTFTTPANCNAIKFRLNGTSLTLTNTMINEGSTALPYSAFIPNQIKVDGNKYTDAINVGNVVDSRSRVNILYSKNLFDKDNVVAGYLSNAGNVISNSSFSTSDFIELNGATKITIDNSTGQSENVCFYNSSKTFISYQATGTNTRITIDVPSNAKYVRATIGNANLNIYIVQEGTEIIIPSINVDNEEIYSKEDVLYLGNDNTITQINLKNNIKDYSYIEIYYRNSWLFTSIKITPNATSIPLTIVYGSSTNGITIHSSVWEVISNGTGLRLVDGRDRDTFISTSPSYNTTRQVYITKVVGYK